MKIQGTQKSSTAAEIKKATKPQASSQTFSDSTGVAQTQSNPASSQVSGIIPTDALLSIQEALTLSHANQESVNNGHKILDALEQVHKGLLLGHFSMDNLTDLVDRIRINRQKAESPELENILEQIELRAEVELAKLSYQRKES